MRCLGCGRVLEEGEPVIEVACSLLYCVRDCARGAVFTQMGIVVETPGDDQGGIQPLHSYVQWPGARRISA